ncbi:TetR/AcrR family transcriptional regulator [Nocardioides sp.]|uniref:TetR/AcrR family transcriptional regulator n=1 Tax=Nocardioides sp. TaxID=35761 RepID=UPI003567F488
MSPQAEAALSRPRVEGDREAEIFDATIKVLVDVGYDRLTMDAVASAARASKATLYRRWNTKLRLVIDALLITKPAPALPDTGSLRGDLLEVFCGIGGITDAESVGVLTSVITAMSRDAEFAEAFRTEILAPKMLVAQQVWERARDRGELRADVDLALFAPAAVGVVLHRVFVLGDQPTPDLVGRVVDQIILPAALHLDQTTTQEQS